MSEPPDPAAIVGAITAGCVRTCARTITRIERGDTSIVPVLQALYRAGGRARVVGITGPPGAGKSSLVSQLIGLWRKRDKRVAVLAVDPSSPFTGGAVLGDRLRMMSHSCDKDVFIRSLASRGQLGGLSKAVGDAVTVLDAMPWDIVVVETVGVGQNETDIMRLADVVVLVQTPIGGDDIQAAKAGINEIGDIYVVNKSDYPEASRTVRHLQDMIALGHRLHPGRSWVPPVVKTQSRDAGVGVDDLADQIDRRFADLAAHPDLVSGRKRAQVRHRAREILRERLETRLSCDGGGASDIAIDSVVRRDRDPYALVSDLLDV